MKAQEVEEEEPICNNGHCEAPKDARGITNCVHCGKELRESDGYWWTYDAEKSPHPVPQDVVRYARD